jgi:hypothetical protein
MPRWEISGIGNLAVTSCYRWMNTKASFYITLLYDCGCLLRLYTNHEIPIKNNHIRPLRLASAQIIRPALSARPFDMLPSPLPLPLVILLLLMALQTSTHSSLQYSYNIFTCKHISEHWVILMWNPVSEASTGRNYGSLGLIVIWNYDLLKIVVHSRIFLFNIRYQSPGNCVQF